eukprot:SAG22_NODE_811_length_7061_cov_84.983338_8_plen_101_part_00
MQTRLPLHPWQLSSRTPHVLERSWQRALSSWSRALGLVVSAGSTPAATARPSGSELITGVLAGRLGRPAANMAVMARSGLTISARSASLLGAGRYVRICP